MPYNPISGEFEYGGESYNAPTMGVGMAMEGMGAAGANVPLAFRLMENMPSVTGSAMFNARRFSNTMFKGGFLDIEAGATAKQVTRARKFGAFVGDVAERPNAKGFLFGKFRSADKLKDSTQFIKASRLNNFSLRPRIFNRLSSVSNLSGVVDAGFYTPFQGASFGSGMLEKMGVRKRLTARGIKMGDKQPLLTGGTLGRISTMSRAYSMEEKLAKGTRRAAKIGDELAGLDRNLTRLVANPEGVKLARARTLGAGFPGSSTYVPEASVGRLRQISDTSGGVISKSITEYMGTVLRPSEFVGTRAFTALESNVKRALYYSQETIGLGAKKAAATAAKETAGKFLAGEATELGQFGVKSLGKLGGKAFMAGERMVGAKLMAASGARALGLAMPGLNVLGTASLVYDLTKMAATGIVSAGNFAKEAVKSMQGSLHKPVFGMGYKDNEVAATSRSRGVMAIQNSRLNARSMLGSEAGMMAAHFG